MRDEMNHNALAITGTPTLVSGGLTVDTDQALQFNGTTNSGSVTDSTSLSITGNLSIEFFVRFPSAPGSTKDLIAKASSYAVQLNTSRKLLFRLDNGGSNVTVTSVQTLATDTWYHVCCVYNQNYAGAQTFGKITTGASNLILDDGDGNNKFVGKFTMPEAGIVSSITMSLRYYDEIWPVTMRALVYTDSGGNPNALVATSESQTFNTPTIIWGTYSWITFPITPVLLSAGDYHIGGIADTEAGPLTGKTVLNIGRETSGGDTERRNDSVSSPSDPFGSVTSATADTLAVYASYTATERTGREGTAAVYINGAFDKSEAYTSGIADNANAVSIAPSFACSLDEISIWNRVLTDLEVATHYTAH